MPCTSLRRGRYDISEELAENVILDLDKKGRIVGVEVWDASKNLGKALGSQNPVYRKSSHTNVSGKFCVSD